MPEIRDWKWTRIAARVVCISRETGAEGETVGRVVATGSACSTSTRR